MNLQRLMRLRRRDGLSRRAYCHHNCVNHTVCLLASLTALISAFISSRVISGSMLVSASFLKFWKASIALARMSSSDSVAEMMNGMRRSRMTWRTKMLMAVLALIPNCSQRLSNIAFCWLSIRTVIAVCGITVDI